MTWLEPAAWYLLAVNVATFLAFGWDKLCARRGRRRVPEATLLALAALGGLGGAYVAMPLFRHKTQKSPFRWRLHAILAAYLVAALAAAYFTLR